MSKKRNFGLVEKVTLIHFLLMFGYKLFSIYFPLYLVGKGFSILEVGYTSFLIYIGLAVFSPVVGYLNHKIRPSLLVVSGVVGYAIYSLLMLISVPGISFYLAQILLGVSGALFFVSSRVFLMGKEVKKKDSAFSWFYSAPSYAEAIAPIVGALLIWKVGFVGAFLASLIVQIGASLFAFSSLRKEKADNFTEMELSECLDNYAKVGNSMKFNKMGFPVLVSFLVLILAGFNNTFFVLFLKDLGLSQDQVLGFNSLICLLFLPISFLINMHIDRVRSVDNISLGGKVVGLFSVILGSLTTVMNLFSLSIIVIAKNIGSLIANSGRSGLMGVRLRRFPEEAAAVDTIFSPLSTAFGALIGGLLIYYFGYASIFIIFGVVIVLSSFFVRREDNL